MGKERMGYGVQDGMRPGWGKCTHLTFTQAAAACATASSGTACTALGVCAAWCSWSVGGWARQVKCLCLVAHHGGK